jgi:hypothetical protein
MTNKVIVIINSLKYQKFRKVYYMKFLVPNYSFLQNPWLGGYRPQILVLCPLSSTEFVEPLPRKIFLGKPLQWCALLLRRCVTGLWVCVSVYKKERDTERKEGRKKWKRNFDVGTWSLCHEVQFGSLFGFRPFSSRRHKTDSNYGRVWVTSISPVTHNWAFPNQLRKFNIYLLSRARII